MFMVYLIDIYYSFSESTSTLSDHANLFLPFPFVTIISPLLGMLLVF